MSPAAFGCTFFSSRSMTPYFAMSVTVVSQDQKKSSNNPPYRVRVSFNNSMFNFVAYGELISQRYYVTGNMHIVTRENG